MRLDISDAVFQSYAFFAGILVLKMLLMSFLTARQRFSKKVFANPEDTKHDKQAKVSTDPDVERVRRAHLNDLENIPVFLIAALLYCFTNPDPGTANLVFKLFTGARIVHTFVYAIFVVPQPSRAVAWAVGQVCTIYLAIKVIMHFA